MPRKRKSSRPPAPARERLIAAALGLAASKGWRRLTIGEIAAEADLPLAEAYGVFRSKYGVLAGFRRDLDRRVLAGGGGSPADSPRDRLFDTLMRRFEALKPHRAAIGAILRDSVGDPALVRAVPGFLSSMGWMLAASGVTAGGVRGHLARRLLGAVYLSVFPTFVRDESADLGSTMAALDRRLRQAEGIVGWASGRGRRRAA